MFYATFDRHGIWRVVDFFHLTRFSFAHVLIKKYAGLQPAYFTADVSFLFSIP
jgi:hypothetical protein